MDFIVISFRLITRKSQMIPPITKPIGINQKAQTSRNRTAPEGCHTHAALELDLARFWDMMADAVSRLP